MTADRDRLVALLSPVVSDAGYDLEDVELSGAGRRTVVRILIDRDGGFGLDDVADVSRDVSTALDAAEHLLPGAYTLEVSSPGVGRPLTLPRHWRRNVTRLVQIKRTSGDPITGRITAAGEDGVTLDVDGMKHDVPYDDVKVAKVQVELRRSATTQPVDDLLDDELTDDDASDDEESDDDDEPNQKER